MSENYRDLSSLKGTVPKQRLGSDPPGLGSTEPLGKGFRGVLTIESTPPGV